MASAYGFDAQLGMASSAPATELYDWKGGDLDIREDDFHDTHGLIGSRDHPSERVRRNTRRPGGTLTLEPNAAELANLLPRILGAAASGTTFALADTLPSFVVVLDKVTKVETYSSCAVDRAVFSGSQGGPLSLELTIEATDTSVGAAGSFPALTLNTSTGPYMFHEATFNVNGSAYNFKTWRLTISNECDKERFFNSPTRQSIVPMDRVITWEFDGPYADNVDLYNLSVTGVACTATFTNSNVSILFSSPAVSFPRKSARVDGTNEILLPLIGIARKSGSTASLVVTNDSTI